MAVRLPRRWWEWALIFSPSIVMLLAVAIDAAYAPRTVEEILADSHKNRGAPEANVAILLWLISGLHFTKPHLSRYVCFGWFLLIVSVLAAVNVAVLFLCITMFFR